MNEKGGGHPSAHERLLSAQFERQALLRSAFTTPEVSAKVINKRVIILIRMHASSDGYY